MTNDPGLAVGKRAPDISEMLVRPDGESVETSLSALAADGPVLLCFYTADFSPKCIEEWCAFRDFDWFASGDHVTVVGASKSGTRLHRRFIDHLGLSFPIYSDTDLRLARAFDIDYRLFGFLPRSRRSCFLLDEDLTVRYKWVGDHWLDPTHSDPPVAEIHEAVRDRLDVDDPDTFGF